MKKLLIAILFVLVTVSGFAAGTTTETSGKALAVKTIVCERVQATLSPRFCVHANGATNLPDGTSVFPAFSVTDYNVGSCWAAVGNVGTFTAPVAGLYRFNAQVTVDAAIAAASWTLIIYLNSSADSLTRFAQNTFDAGIQTSQTRMSESVYLTGGDTVYVRFAQVGAASVGVSYHPTVLYTYFSGELIH